MVKRDHNREGTPAQSMYTRLMIVAVVAGAVGLCSGASISLGEAAQEQEAASDAAEEGASEEAKGEEGALQEKVPDVEVEEGEEMLGAIVPLDTFLLNLVGGKYIRVQMQLEFNTLDIPKRFYGRAVPIRDAIIAFLTQEKAEDLQTPKGKQIVKESVKRIVNEQLSKNVVRRVYFTQFVIQ